MNEGEHRLAAEVEKLIEKCENTLSFRWEEFKLELRNIITKYE
tara:strand:+ start:1291 stop:1419 length:129 start_codon:yes stop_codon:yes gene_type:complete